MNYIFTAAGAGTRFLKDGIKPPKPLIRARGQELLLWSMSSFKYAEGDTIYLATLEEHNCKRIIPRLRLQYPSLNINLIEFDSVLNGQLCTACEVIKSFSINGPLLIHNCDTAFDFNSEEYRLLESSYPEAYGMIPVFHGSGDHWSFALTEPSHPTNVVRITEKQRISNNCSIGTYIFGSAQAFLRDATLYMKNNRDSELGEFYVAPFMDHMLNSGETIHLLSARNPRLFGTPAELKKTFGLSSYELISENSALAHQRRTLVVDIDNTICANPQNHDYSTCVPIQNIVDSLRRHHENGAYIILFTSRNMRTFNGSIGLINKYTAPVILDWLKSHSIPYDEIVYGKPWGTGELNYLDDKNISLDRFGESL